MGQEELGAYCSELFRLSVLQFALRSNASISAAAIFLGTTHRPPSIGFDGTETDATRPCASTSTSALAMCWPSRVVEMMSAHFPWAGFCQRTAYIPICGSRRMSRRTDCLFPL